MTLHLCSCKCPSQRKTGGSSRCPHGCRRKEQTFTGNLRQAQLTTLVSAGDLNQLAKSFWSVPNTTLLKWRPRKISSHLPMQSTSKNVQLSKEQSALHWSAHNCCSTNTSQHYITFHLMSSNHWCYELYSWLLNSKFQGEYYAYSSVKKITWKARLSELSSFNGRFVGHVCDCLG